MTHARRLRAGILVFPEVEVLDFCGPFEVFSAARPEASRPREAPSPFEVLLVAATTAPVTAAGGLTVMPHADLAGCPTLDVLVVPGGWGTRALLSDEGLLGWIRDRAGEAGIVASVCTGALLLGAAGLLDGRRATTHWGTLDEMADRFPATTVVRDRHFVEDGPVVTSAGISAGIDLALVVVARLLGEPVARATARYMEYPYPDDAGRRIGPA